MVRVWTPEGPKDGVVDVVLADGKVQAIGVAMADLAITGAGATWQGRACAVVDTSGRQVTAGMTEFSSQFGLVEVGMEGESRHGDAGGDHPVRAAFRAVDAYDPRSTLIPVNRAEGITSAIVQPGGGRVSGQAGVVDLAGATQADVVVGPSVAVVASIEGESHAAGLHELRALFDDVRFYEKNRAAYDRAGTRELRAGRLDLEALLPVVQGKVPLILAVDRAADLEAVVRFQREAGVRVIVSGGAEGWLVADQLAAAKIPVVIDPLVFGPGAFTQLRARPDNAALLHKAGVQVILSSFDTHNARTLRQDAGNAVREGLPYAAALASVTSAPLRAVGIVDRGELAPGQVANVVVWGGDPLEVLTSAEAVFIRGRAIPLDHRQWRLMERYRDLAAPASVPLP
jgi:imidazolonepropionase-like amidohydrolase